MDNKYIDKLKKSDFGKNFGFAFLGILLGILITPAFSPLIASIYYPVDTEPPQISNLNPVDNVYTYNITNISATVIDHGGSGIDFKKSNIILSSSKVSSFEGNYSFSSDTIFFTPAYSLPPDEYTATFIVYDKAKRVQEKSTRFIVLEEPKSNIKIYESPKIYSSGDEIYNLIWDDNYTQFNFIIENKCSNTVYENLELTFDFPGTVLQNVITLEKGCQTPDIKDSFSKVILVENGKTNSNVSTSTLVIETDRMYPGGVIGGTVFIDPYYEIKEGNDLVIFSDSTGMYYGKYSHSQFGRIYTESINSLINATPEFYLEKGKFIKEQATETHSYERILTSLNHFNKALELGLNNSEIWTEKGECYLYLGNFSEAIKCFNNGIKFNDNARAYYDLGILYYKLGNFEKSTYYSEKALDINSGYHLAETLLEKSRNDTLTVFPENVPTSSLESMNDREGTIYFTTRATHLLSHPQEQILFFDFNINNTRFICSRAPNNQLVYMVLDLESGIHLAQIDLRTVPFTVEKTGICLIYSEEKAPELILYNGAEMLSEKAMLNKCILTNPFEQDTGLGITFTSPEGYPITYFLFG